MEQTTKLTNFMSMAERLFTVTKKFFEYLGSLILGKDIRKDDVYFKVIFIAFALFSMVAMVFQIIQ